MKRFRGVALLAFLSACGGLPKHKEISTDNPSILEIVGDPDGAKVWSDGTTLGTIERKKVRFSIPSGRRDVKITLGAATLYDRVIFVEKGTTRQGNLTPIK